MRHPFTRLLLAIAVTLIAPPLRSQCAPISVSVENPRAGETVPARAQVAIDGSLCLHYVELSQDADSIAVIFQATPAVTNVDPPNQVTAFPETQVPNGVQVPLRLRNPGTHTLRFKVDQPAGSVLVDLYVARKPEIQVERTGADCVLGYICLAKGATTQVLFEGTGLDEVDLSAGVTIGAQRFALALDRNHLVAQIPPGILALQPQNVTFRTRRPFLNTAGAITSEVVLQAVRVSQSSAKYRLSLVSEGDTREPTVFVGQNVVLDIDVPTGATLTPDTYALEEVTGQQQRTVVGLLDVLASAAGTATVRILGLAPTSNDVHGDASFVYVMNRDSVHFHSRISVQHRPTVESWTIHHTDSRHRDQSVHPGETVLLTLTGKNLLAFDDVRVGGAECPAPCGFEHPSPNEIRIRFPFAGPPVDRLPVVLESAVTRDTTIYLPTAPALQPRPLDFATLMVDSVHFHFRPNSSFPFLGLRERRTRGYPLGGRAWGADSLNVEIRTNTLHGLRLVFDEARLNQGGLFGPQHLVVSAILYSPDREKVEEDSLRLSIAPLDSTLTSRLTPAGGTVSNRRRIVPLDDLVDRLGRFSQPGSSIEIAIRHDSIRYGGEPGFREHLTIRNATRFRVRPHAEVLAGAFYIARTRGAREKTLAPSGAPADTVSHPGEPRTGFDALSMLGSIGIDAAVLNDEGRPTFARMRVGLLAMQSPFDTDSPRQFGVSMLYPIELVSTRGGLALSISGGGVCLFNERCFALISPGFSMTLGN